MSGTAGLLHFVFYAESCFLAGFKLTHCFSIVCGWSQLLCTDLDGQVCPLQNVECYSLWRLNLSDMLLGCHPVRLLVLTPVRTPVRTRI